MKMKDIEYRDVIKYFFKGNMPLQIRDELDEVYGDSAPSFATVKLWTVDLKFDLTYLVQGGGLGHIKIISSGDNILPNGAR